MTRHDRFSRPGGGPAPATTSPAGQHPCGHRPARPALTLIPGTGLGTRVELSTLTRQPMPGDARGALVAPVHGTPMATWVPLDDPSPIPQGRILLSWTPAGEDRTDVTAHLGLAGAQVLLAVWPGLRGEWSDVVRPTVAEVTELHAALHLATALLDRLTD
ncbi:hypothetical protein SAMN06272735_8812 [Streptomyces sp. TLI_55]|uniref:hypothetical protein n=1 Tax=Streptomyces sp. TLI_55 TaxID=1938861 RepID=UPI000BD3F8A5|nr:hypothetical protein [Streptomyces sp. TLI_55]SNX88368.1 hypothetical protein SAMN06272735_8812 [Streptomyces sp. TLI_55]